MVVFNLAAPGANLTTKTFPANTLIWTNYVMQNSSYLFTIQTNLQVYASNYNSIVWGAIYVNGQLASEADYTLVAPPHVASNGTELASSGEVAWCRHQFHTPCWDCPCH